MRGTWDGNVLIMEDEKAKREAAQAVLSANILTIVEFLLNLVEKPIPAPPKKEEWPEDDQVVWPTEDELRP